MNSHDYSITILILFVKFNFGIFTMFLSLISYNLSYSLQRGCSLDLS